MKTVTEVIKIYCFFFIIVIYCIIILPVDTFTVPRHGWKCQNLVSRMVIIKSKISKSKINQVKIVKEKKAAREELPLPIDTCGLAEWDFDPESWYAP